MDVKKTDTNVLRVTMDAKSGNEFWFLLRSDAHHDSPKCDRSLEKKHLDQALERNAKIIDIGDLFCAMQGKYDPRSDKGSLRPEHQVNDYLDALVRTTVDDYTPYAKNWLVMGKGNHETAITKRHETDLTDRLATVLNYKANSNIQTLGYSGWIKFIFKYSQTGQLTQSLWFTHGYGGGSPVTHGIIASARENVYIENADIMVSGHVHRSWVQEFVKLRLTNTGVVQRRIGFYVKTPTYKDAYGDGTGGFEVERGMGPRPLGAYWLKFTCGYLDGRRIVTPQIIKAD